MGLFNLVGSFINIKLNINSSLNHPYGNSLSKRKKKKDIKEKIKRKKCCLEEFKKMFDKNFIYKVNNSCDYERNFFHKILRLSLVFEEDKIKNGISSLFMELVNLLKYQEKEQKKLKNSRLFIIKYFKNKKNECKVIISEMEKSILKSEEILCGLRNIIFNFVFKLLKFTLFITKSMINSIKKKSSTKIKKQANLQENIIEPIIKEFSDNLRRVRKNLLIYSSIVNSILWFDLIKKNEATISIYGIDISANQNIFYFMLECTVFYNFIYFCIMAYESILYNQLQLTGIFRFKPDDFCEKLLYYVHRFLEQYEENQKNLLDPTAPRYRRDDPNLQKRFKELEGNIIFFKTALSAIDKPFFHYQLLDKIRYFVLELLIPFSWALVSFYLYFTFQPVVP